MKKLKNYQESMTKVHSLQEKIYNDFSKWRSEISTVNGNIGVYLYYDSYVQPEAQLYFSIKTLKETLSFQINELDSLIFTLQEFRSKINDEK